MARYTGSNCRLCRREGTKLFLKGLRCTTDKCPVSKRSYAPGQHGQRRIKLSNYGQQLREKQKVKRIYGVLEKQFRTYFKKVERTKGITGEMLLQLLERRLDNVIFRLNFALTRSEARQIVGHGHIRVNNKKVDIPSYLVKKGDSIDVKTTPKRLPRIKEVIELAKERGVPGWLKQDPVKVKGEVIGLPSREDVGFPIQEKLIVELYSK